MEKAGLELPSYTEVGTFDGVNVKGKITENLASGCWEFIQRGLERPFDAVLMKGEYAVGSSWKRAPTHIGTIIRPGMMIHVEESMMYANCISLNHSDIVDRFVGIYRHRELQ